MLTSAAIAGVFKIGLLLVVGVTLLGASAGCFALAYEEVSGRGELVIDPLSVVDEVGHGDEALGITLAQMLQTRLDTLAMELQGAQEVLAAGSPTEQAARSAPFGDVRMLRGVVPLRSRLLQPAELKLTVGGLDIGGVLPWIQRRIATQRTLHFTVYLRGAEAQVFGSLAPMRVKGGGVHLTIPGAEGKPPSYDLVVERLAHELLRRALVEDPSNRVELLAPEEFVILSAAMVNAAAANRRELQRRPAQAEFRQIFPAVAALAREVPDWVELAYFAGWLADRSDDAQGAAEYYHRVVRPGATSDRRLVEQVNARLEAMGAPVLAGAPDAAGTLPAKVDYASEIKWVRNQGNEGSVAAQALATALEFQIARSLHEERRISARYIYWIARAAAGKTAEDVGSTLSGVLDAVARTGAVEESVWPYRQGQYAEAPPPEVETARRFRIANVQRVEGVLGVKRALNANGPVVAGLTWYASGFGGERKGVIPVPGAKEQVVGGHAVTIVGYDDDRKLLKFVNSWGREWGEGGFGYLPYAYFERDGEAWTFLLAK